MYCRSGRHGPVVLSIRLRPPCRRGRGWTTAAPDSTVRVDGVDERPRVPAVRARRLAARRRSRGVDAVACRSAEFEAQVLFTSSLKYVPAGTGSLTTQLTIVSSYALAALVLGEAVPARALGGGALVLVGVLLASTPRADRAGLRQHQARRVPVGCEAPKNGDAPARGRRGRGRRDRFRYGAYRQIRVPWVASFEVFGIRTALLSWLATLR